MSQNASPDIISSIIDTAVVNLKSQLAALLYIQDITTTTSTTTTTTTLAPSTTTTTTTTTTLPTTTTTTAPTTTTTTVKPTTTSTTTQTTTQLPVVMPGGKVSSPLILNNASNQIISGLSIDGGSGSIDLLTLNNCTNVHITLCRFSNTNGNAIRLNNCTNCTVDYNFFTFVGFGVYAYKCVSTKVNNNQGLNRWAPVLYNGNFSHWVQFNGCSGTGQQVNNNIFEDVYGIAVHPHDSISIYLSNGLASDPIQVNGNWLRGGQVDSGWPTAGDTGVGITIADVSGNYQQVLNNILVNPGYEGIICVGSGNGIDIENNIIYSDKFKNNLLGISIQDQNQITCGGNRVFWNTYKSFGTTMQSDGEPAYWNPSSTPAPLKWSSNVWQDKTVTSLILPKTIITYK